MPVEHDSLKPHNAPHPIATPQVGQPTEIEKLVAAAQAGSESARQELYREFSPLIAWHARKYASSNSSVDDISQEGLMGFIRAIDTFDPTQGAQFKTYATTCISNAAISAARKLHTQDSHLLYEGEYGTSIEEFSGSGFEEEVHNKFTEKEHRDKLLAVLTSLEFEAFMLRVKGYPPREIALKLDTSVSSINNALARARKKVKDLAE